MTLPTFNTFAPTDTNQRPCGRCPEPYESHPPSRYYADAEDDPSAELLMRLKEVTNHLRKSCSELQRGGRCLAVEGGDSAIERAQTTIDNATVRLCKDGDALLNQALEMDFEEQTR